MNPYQVLGINENATQEQIRAAYVSLVKKYHPDKHHDNPLRELAGEKIKEINHAYELLAKKTVDSTVRSQTAAAANGAWNDTQTASQREPKGTNHIAYERTRYFIDRNNLGGARAILDAVSDHTAEWFYLSGIIDLRQGQYEKAYDSIARAYQLAPNHSEYRNAYLSLKKTGNPYKRMRTGTARGCLFGLFGRRKRY